MGPPRVPKENPKGTRRQIDNPRGGLKSKYSRGPLRGNMGAQGVANDHPKTTRGRERKRGRGGGGEGEGREGKARDGKGREGKGREGKVG